MTEKGIQKEGERQRKRERDRENEKLLERGRKEE